MLVPSRVSPWTTLSAVLALALWHRRATPEAGSSQKCSLPFSGDETPEALAHMRKLLRMANDFEHFTAETVKATETEIMAAKDKATINHAAFGVRQAAFAANPFRHDADADADGSLKFEGKIRAVKVVVDLSENAFNKVLDALASLYDAILRFGFFLISSVLIAVGTGLALGLAPFPGARILAAGLGLSGVAVWNMAGGKENADVWKVVVDTLEPYKASWQAEHDACDLNGVQDLAKHAADVAFDALFDTYLVVDKQQR